MKRTFLFLVICSLLTFNSYAQSHSKVQSYSYHVFKTFNDYVNGKYKTADKFTGKEFKKGKEEIGAIKEIYGYEYVTDSFTVTFRIMDNKTMVVIVCGSLCLYTWGDLDERKGKINLIFDQYNNFQTFYVSKGLDGEMFKYKNIDDNVKSDDEQFLTLVKNTVNVSFDWEKFVNSHIEPIQYWNSKHTYDKCKHDPLSYPN